MYEKLKERLEIARSSFWYIPSLMMTTGIVLFAATLSLDKLGVTGAWLGRVFYSGGPSNAGNLLQTLTGAMVAIATVVFSTMMVVLTLATSQFGHRLIRSFMRDRANQSVLGIFLATFVYCLLVFHMVGNDPKNQFVPGISLTVGFALSIFSTCTLIYFTHHMAALVSAPRVLETVAGELDGAIARVYPDSDSPEPADADGVRAPELGHGTQEIVAEHGGYVQTVGEKALITCAKKHDVLIESRVSYGDYVFAGTVLARVHGRELADDAVSQVVSQYVLGPDRTTDRDLMFAVNQVSEIAVRALSPALNNPYTALDCLNRIGRSLATVLGRPRPSEAHVDDDGELRLVLRLPYFPSLFDTAFMPIRNYGRTSVETLEQMLSVIEKLAPLTRRSDEREMLARHAEAIRESAEHGLREQIDVDRIKWHFGLTREALEAAGSHTPEPPAAV
ncbi:DUF2254 domain-containing protein [Salinisphaera sp. Q1T1-3]|uniref:DUF2254 domain-containing protein n=1 Tax=Salinisphaera sp. Q1T1-3 TaxID=2321229 RepID=UPI000E749305|nr:DUF2254 domain-containing protein [Salinisphaera sp. Q1T1-3]RJS93717.1 DUF2254 domain-containing protein [Salinisphaera sp. Q1T1-3]